MDRFKELSASPLQWVEQQLRASGIQDSRLEAQLLLAYVLDCSRVSIITQTHPTPTEAQFLRILELTQARIARTPFAYLRSTQEFYGITFKVSSATLIPRPETELLVDFGLKVFIEDFAQIGNNSKKWQFADVGTGTGCIALSLLYQHTLTTKAVTNIHAIATDISAEALDIANWNATNLRLNPYITFIKTNLLEGIPSDSLNLILSNPPYIAESEIENLMPEVRLYEPKLALSGGTDGFDTIRPLISSAWRALKLGGWLAFEIGMGQSETALALLNENGYKNTKSICDLAGIPRVVVGRKLTSSAAT